VITLVFLCGVATGVCGTLAVLKLTRKPGVRDAFDETPTVTRPRLRLEFSQRVLRAIKT